MLECFLLKLHAERRISVVMFAKNCSFCIGQYVGSRFQEFISVASWISKNALCCYENKICISI